MDSLNITTIKQLLSFACKNKYSGFYREKYKSAGLSEKEMLDPKNFSKLPFLERMELAETPPDSRLFISPDKMEFVAYTSGTSSQNPLITYFGKVKNYCFDPTLGLGVKRLLITYPPLNKNFGHTFIQQCIQSKNKSTPIFGDFQNLANSAVLASKTNPDAVYATPTIAYLLSEFLEKHYDLKKIKLLALSSETLTETKRKQLEEKYPNAKIANLYASSEIGQFALYPCKKIISEKVNHFHVLTPPLIKTELISNELVVTYANNPAMPLIRYRTGDFFEIVSENCGCGIKGLVLKWAGREDVDKIRVAGIEIKLEDVEKTFSAISHLTRDRYQIHFYEDPSNKIKITVEILKPVEKSPISHEDIKAGVLGHLMNNWRLSPSAKLKDAIAKGIFSALEIKIVEKFSFEGLKNKRLISHLK